MGYGGKVWERERARELRAQSWTLAAIAAELGVSKASVSVWVRDVDFEPRPRQPGPRPARPHPFHLAKLAEIEHGDAWGHEVVGTLTDRELLLVGAALYAGEGSKTDGCVRFANTNSGLVVVFMRWLRSCFAIDESRLRVSLYLHEGLDLAAATDHWAAITSIPVAQFRKPYRAVADPTRRNAKHVNGCVSVVYSDASLHRRVMGLVRALSSDAALPG
jgi:Putative ATPase subunit of terminase (gpP-like)